MLTLIQKLKDNITRSSHLIIFTLAVIIAISALTWLAFHEFSHRNEIKQILHIDLNQIHTPLISHETKTHLSSIESYLTKHLESSFIHFFIIGFTIILLGFSWVYIFFNRRKITSLKTNEQQLEELLYYDHVKKLHDTHQTSYPVPDSIKQLQLNRDAFISQLKQGIKQHQFLLYFQPIVNTQTGEIADVEALVRWNHPQHGLLNPQYFLSLCETTGLIIPLGQWVLETACRQIKHWHELGYTQLDISVNLSTQQLTHSNLLLQIKNTLELHQLSPSSLKLEITEDSLMKNIESSIQLLRSLRKLGVKLALDDFGTGYSYLKYVKEFPISNIKIDKSFIHEMTTDITSFGIVESIINLGKSLGLTMTAEGVEHKHQLHLLKKLNCDFIQGYLYSKPIPANEFTELLKKHNTLPHDLLSPVHFHYHPLNASHVDQVVDLISKAFCENEPMTKYLQIRYEEFIPFATLLVDKAVQDGLSMVALENNTVAACTIIEDMADSLDTSLTHDSKFKTLFSFLEHLGKDFFNERVMDTGHVAHVFITAVDKKYQGQGLSKKINFESIRHAENKGFDFMCCEFTHSYHEKGTLQHLENSRLLIRSVKYNEFVYEGIKPFEHLEGYASAYIWELREGAKLHYKINV